MSEHGSVTVWIDRMKAGDRDDAVTALWGRYFAALVGKARTFLQGRQRPAADEEDVALAAFDSFVRAAAKGRFPRLAGRDDLWELLLMVAARKAADVVTADLAAKRGGGRVAAISALAGADGSAPDFAAEPAGSEAEAVAEGVGRLLAKLPDDELRRIALLKLEGDTDAEIGRKIDRSVATVERKLRRIRKAWEDELPSRPGDK